MSTNRTKIDWAYRQAERLMSEGVFTTPLDRIRAIAALLRRAEKRGQKIERNAQTLRWSLPKLTVETIRRCKQQLEASEVQPNTTGNWTMRVLNPETQILTKHRHKRMR